MRSLRRAWIVPLLAALGLLLPGPLGAGPAAADSAANLPACPHFSNVVPPNRSDTPFKLPAQQAPPLDVSGRLPVPTGIAGTFSGGRVNISLNRVPGARAYRVFRNGQGVAWIDDWGQPALTASDAQPCRNAFYSFVAMRDFSGSNTSMGQYSQPWRLGDDGNLAPFSFAKGSTLRVMTTSYNDGGPTASGYTAGHGICAVDARVIPWGTRLLVPGYGHCYAADIGLWIQGNVVDVWLPGQQAFDWGVQTRDIVFQ